MAFHLRRSPVHCRPGLGICGDGGREAGWLLCEVARRPRACGTVGRRPPRRGLVPGRSAMRRQPHRHGPTPSETPIGTVSRPPETHAPLPPAAPPRPWRTGPTGVMGERPGGSSSPM
jgi:hypothetical protein